MTIATPALTLKQFLNLPETKPASEFINGKIIQKPMPQGEHSRLQGKLCAAINRVAESVQMAYAFPELRCTFGGQSIVPDVAVFRWSRIPRLPSGRIENRFTSHPDWSIEVLSPEQSQTRVLGNLLHCAQHGTELGWLVDPDEETVLVVWPDQRVQLLQGEALLPGITDLDLSLTVDQMFGWLTL
ncbi:MAG: Uma2 family endonuclease [Leptolyngbyaceae cyanobacterium SM2_5_2]|nr:Uma2 family endonuclease [Leptolyngbyaceae cyanobacterium SM2_5_2]